MSKPFRQWILFAAVLLVVGVMVSAMTASLGVTAETVRHEVRMPVDFTVLPVVLPDGSESPAMPPEDPPVPAETEPVVVVDEPAGQEESLPAPTPKAKARVPEPAPKPKAGTPRPAPEKSVEGRKAPVVPKGKARVQSVALAETDWGFVLEVRTDRPVGDTTYMNLPDPARLVVDLHGKWAYKGPNVLRSVGAVKHVVLGQHADKMRFVVHFRTPPAKKLAPKFSADGNLLKISVDIP